MRKRRRIRKLRVLVLALILGIVAFAAFVFGIVQGIRPQLEALDPARQQHVQADGFIFADDGHTVLARLVGSQSRKIVSSDAINYTMMQAIVAAEDKRFYDHRGLDVRGISRAIWANLRNKAVVEGGSTITQQFVKNAYVSSHRSLSRKLKEAALAWQLEQRWSKQKILTAYLNTIYFGNGAYGVERAARTYFGHAARKLTWAEAALLAGIPEDPSRYDPMANPAQARNRRDQVLRLMLDQGRIPRRFYVRALQAPMPKNLHFSATRGQAPYFAEYVKQQLIRTLHTGCVFGGGLRVVTTIDLDLQRRAQAAIKKWLPDPKGPQAALVAIRPSDGAVLAMVGGNNFNRSQFNLAVQGERQPGSAFKPFVLTTAVRQGIAPESTFKSQPVSIYIGGRYWYVHNFGNEYEGLVSLATATTNSDNSVYAQLTKLVGPRHVVETARRLGITSPLQPYFAIGLGAEPVNPLEMARAYATLANNGVRVDSRLFGNMPRAVKSVSGCGKPRQPNEVAPKPVIPSEQSAVVTSLLEGVVRSGTGVAAALPDRPVAGKTGTTENYGDAWFVGYTPQLAVAVWVGYPTRLVPMRTNFHGEPVTGGTYPARIWKSFMESALSTMGPEGAPQYFPAPPLLSTVARRVAFRDGRLELDNGYCRDTTQLVYYSSIGPSHTADCKPNEVDVPRVVGQRLAVATARLRAQPLTPALVFKPAAPRQHVGIVLAQYPKRGTLSSFDTVRLVVAKPLYGLVPKVVGLRVGKATRRLRKVDLIATVDGPADGVVVQQLPEAGVAAAPGMHVKVVVRRGSRSASPATDTAKAARSRG